MTDCMPALTSEFAGASGNAATAETAARFFTVMAACGRNTTTSPPSPSASTAPELGQGLDNFTTGPLPDVSVLVTVQRDETGYGAVCSKFDADSRENSYDFSTFYGASGRAMPPDSDIKALADVMCSKSAEGAAAQFLEEVVGGGQPARVAVAAFFLPQYACTTPLAELPPNTIPPAHQALALHPVMTDPKTVMKYTVAAVKAADEIGLPLCITVVVAEPSPFTQVLASEQVHTGKSLGVWPDPSGQTLPAGMVMHSVRVDSAEPVLCKTYNGTDWETDPSNGPHGSSGTADPPKKELKAFSDIVCKKTTKQAATALADAVAKGGKSAQAALGAVFLEGPTCEDGTSVYNATNPVWSAFWDLPELNSPTTVMRYVPNMAEALDSIGISACLSIAVTAPYVGDNEVFYQGQFHTNATDTE